MTIRIAWMRSPVALRTGAGLFLIHVVARSFLTAGQDPAKAAGTSAWVPTSLVGVFGALLVLVGLPAIFRRVMQTGRALPLLGLVLITFAWCFFGVFLSFLSLLIAPWLAEKAPMLLAPEANPSGTLFAAFVVFLVAQILGAALLAPVYLRGEVKPRWVGYLLLASALLWVLGDLMTPSGPSRNIAINLFSNLGMMLFLLALVDQGLRY